MGMRGDHSIPPGDKYELELILLKMIHTKKFCPSSDWILGRFCDGLQVERAHCLLKMATRPQECHLADINLIFFCGYKFPPRVSSEELTDLIVDNHVPECTLNGGPCLIKERFEEFLSHFSFAGPQDPEDAKSDSDVDHDPREGPSGARSDSD